MDIVDEIDVADTVVAGADGVVDGPVGIGGGTNVVPS